MALCEHGLLGGPYCAQCMAPVLRARAQREQEQAEVDRLRQQTTQLQKERDDLRAALDEYEQ